MDRPEQVPKVLLGRGPKVLSELTVRSLERSLSGSRGAVQQVLAKRTRGRLWNARGTTCGFGCGFLQDMSMMLDGFATTTFTHDGKTRDVFRKGSGPAVIVIAEMPGITPDVVAFADRVVDIGCTAVLPHLFGDPGRPLSAGYTLRSMAPACVSREFAVWATGRTSPVIDWLRALAAHEHEVCGGPGVGAVGMCFTGGFALAMAVDDRMLAPVLSQPSLPFPITKRHRRDVGLSEADLARVKHRCENDGLCVLGLRFTGDRLVPAERFARLRSELGDAFVGVEIDSSDGNEWGHPRAAHSVLTLHLKDEPGPTRDALDKVLDLFRSRLLQAQA